METKKSRITFVTFLLLLLLTLGATVWMIWPYILALVMGVILARLSNSFYQWLRGRGLGPSLSSFVTVLCITFLVIGPLTAFSIQAVKQGVALGHAISENPEISLQGIFERVSQWSPIENFIDNPAELETQLKESFQSHFKNISATVLNWAASVPGFVLQLVIAILTCYFILIDGDKLRSWFSEKIPLDRDIQKKIAKSFQATSRSVVWATLAAAASQAALMFIGYIALGVPAAFLAAGATFIFAWLPVIGSSPVWLMGALYLYFKGSVAKTIAMVVIGLLTGIVDNFIRPLVLRGGVEMHPMVSLVAIFGGISLFGVLGVFIGPILAALLISLMEIWPGLWSKIQ